eukprot:m.228993 g.228993  ORF g.228993 m.228993 type:complete len:742 (-) comp11834_c0_seq1:88-2313(-)
MAAYNLPLLPGLSPNTQLGKSRHHKPQGLVFQNEQRTVLLEAPGIGGTQRTGSASSTPKSSSYPAAADGSSVPAWLAFDRQVLRFEAYFQEAVVERRDESNRVRAVKILFYLEDDTVQVIEPAVQNSGLPQGTLLRRHRVPKPAPNDDQFYTVDDFNVGKDITIYGRLYTLFACDPFTRTFLTKLGVRVPEDSSAPADAFTETRRTLKESMQAFKPFEKHDTLKQFLENDRKVLRFYCVWDDTESPFGDRRYMVLLYFLADDTISLHEILPPNSGRDSGSAFLRRQKLPKDTSALVKHPGQTTPRTVLNVFGPSLSGRHILDNLRTGALNDSFYTDADLSIGAVMEVYGRRVLLCDCDQFTKEFYGLKYNVTDFTPIDVKDESGQAVSTELPPYNGFGSEEDSLQSCLSLLPQPPRPTPGQHLGEQTGLERAVLRFLAKLDSGASQDAERRFIVTYYLVDDTISVFEQRQSNSGMAGGKFQERKKVRTADGARYLSGHDVYVGGVVALGGHRFEILDADEFAFNFMYENKFPESDPAAIAARLKKTQPDKLASAVAAVKIASKDGVLASGRFIAELQRSLGPLLNEQNTKALLRAFAGQGAPVSQDLDLLVSQVQSVLAKKNYSNFTSLNRAFLHYDKGRNGALSKEQIKQVCLEYNLPVDDSLLTALIERMPTNPAGGIDYQAFSKCLHYTTSPALKQSASFTSSAADNLSTTVRSVVYGSAHGNSTAVDVSQFTAVFDL